MSEQEKIILILKKFFQKEHTKFKIKIAFLYGSWSGGYPRSDSDLDLAVLFSGEIDDQEEIFDLIENLSYQLQEHLVKEVNILSISMDFPHPMLYYNVIVQGIPVWVKDKNILVKLKLEAISQMEDFQLFGTGWQLEIARKNFKEAGYA